MLKGIPAYLLMQAGEEERFGRLLESRRNAELGCRCQVDRTKHEERSAVPYGGRRERRMTRKEVAEMLGVSTKTVERLERKGVLRRCPNLGTLVRFDPSDVLRLASAPRKER